MRKNRMMRAASALLVAVLMTTCTISGTFAKYVTEASSQDTARVANWGFTKDTIVELDMFDSTYDDDVAYQSENGAPTNLIAPGTEKLTNSFSIINAETNKPEVKYSFSVSVDGSDCAQVIQDNKNIIWYLDGAKVGTNGTWAELMDAIKLLSGDASGTETYLPGTVPAAFASGVTHTVGWQWLFDVNGDVVVYDLDTDGTPETTQNQYDTMMGNAADLADVTLKITVTATQISD